MSTVDTDDISNRVRRMLSRMMKLKESAVTLEAQLRDDLGVDSVDIWEIMTKMEEEFGVEVKESDAVGVNTVQDVVNVVKGKMQAFKA